MVEKSCQFLNYIFCYDETKLKKMVKFYVSTWTLFAGPVTYVHNIGKCIYLYVCFSEHLYMIIILGVLISAP